MGRSSQQYSSTGSDNGLAPSRWQAIVWTNNGYFNDAYMHHSASMIYLAKIILSELTPRVFFYIKMLSCQYMKSCCRDKANIKSSYLINGNSYTGWTALLKEISPQGIQGGQCYTMAMASWVL